MNTDKGLVDLHGHWYEGSAFGIDPAICLNHGVTTVVDAGTTGFVNFEELRRTRTENAPLRVLAFLNIAAIGIPTTLAGELEDLRYARPVETASPGLSSGGAGGGEGADRVGDVGPERTGRAGTGGGGGVRPAGAGDGPHQPGGGDARDPAPAAPGGTS